MKTTSISLSLLSFIFTIFFWHETDTHPSPQGLNREPSKHHKAPSRILMTSIPQLWCTRLGWWCKDHGVLAGTGTRTECARVSSVPQPRTRRPHRRTSLSPLHREQSMPSLFHIWVKVNFCSNLELSLCSYFVLGQLLA